MDFVAFRDNFSQLQYLQINLFQALSQQRGTKNGINHT